MYAAGVQELRLTLLLADVVGDPGKQELPAVDALADAEHGANGGVIVLELVHHLEVGLVGGIKIPVLYGVGVHLRFHHHRLPEPGSRQELKRKFKAGKTVETRPVGIGIHPARACIIDGNHVRKLLQQGRSGMIEPEVYLPPGLQDAIEVVTVGLG